MFQLFARMNNRTWPGIADKVTDLYAPDPNLPDYRLDCDNLRIKIKVLLL